MGSEMCIRDSVDRDDLEDGGSEHFYKVVKATREKNPETSIEVLTPDFLRKGDAYKKVLEADLDVFNHNIETVPRLYTKVRPGARYFASLELLKNAKAFNKKVFTKSGIMVGLGETKEEVIQVMDDLRSAEVDFITIGQYIQPSAKHHPLDRYYHPDEFKEFENIEIDIGIRPDRVYYYYLAPTDALGNERTSPIQGNWIEVKVDEVEVSEYHPEWIPPPPEDPETITGTDFELELLEYLDKPTFQVAGLITIIIMCLNFVLIPYSLQQRKKASRRIDHLIKTGAWDMYDEDEDDY